MEQRYFSVTQLTKMGWSRDTLYQIAHSKNQKCAFKPGGGKFLFDIVELEKYKERKLVR